MEDVNHAKYIDVHANLPDSNVYSACMICWEHAFRGVVVSSAAIKYAKAIFLDNLNGQDERITYELPKVISAVDWITGGESVEIRAYGVLKSIELGADEVEIMVPHASVLYDPESLYQDIKILSSLCTKNKITLKYCLPVGCKEWMEKDEIKKMFKELSKSSVAYLTNQIGEDTMETSGDVSDTILWMRDVGKQTNKSTKCFIDSGFPDHSMLALKAGCSVIGISSENANNFPNTYADYIESINVKKDDGKK